MIDTPTTPADEIRRRTAERGWTQGDLARVLGRTNTTVNQLANGKRSVTPEMAVALSAALGDSPEYWLNLETQIQLAQVRQSAEEVRRRAAIFEHAPVKDMERRGWIAPSDTAEDLEDELCAFYGVNSLEERPAFAVATRRSSSVADHDLDPLQLAWCTQARNIAADIPCKPFDAEQVGRCVSALKRLTGFPQEARKVPKVLLDHGIRFVVVEPFPSTKTAGATFWLDGSAPVIAMSLLLDRIDRFWFTLAHELSHVRHGDALSVDSEPASSERNVVALAPEEKRADEEAGEMWIAAKDMKSFIARTAPLYSKKRINQFANRIKVHPGIITGQLQHRGEIGYRANREMLVPVREFVTSTAVTDGWGHSLTPRA